VDWKKHVKNLIDFEKILKESITNQTVKDCIDKMFMFSIIWGFGGSLSESLKMDFQDCIKNTFKKWLGQTSGAWWEF